MLSRCKLSFSLYKDYSLSFRLRLRFVFLYSNFFLFLESSQISLASLGLVISGWWMIAPIWTKDTSIRLPLAIKKKKIVTNTYSFFFLISKNVIYTNGYSMQEKHRANLENTRRRKQKKTEKENQQPNNYKRERELRKEGRESLVVSPHARDQSKRVLLKEAIIWTLELSTSSKVRRFLSFQIHHRMHNGTKFQTWDECFPNQFHQPKSKSGIDLGITQDKPKVIKTKLHNR